MPSEVGGDRRTRLISAIDRINMRVDLRNHLLKGVNFCRFPPLTMYINGWPIQLWEAIIANIDSKAILYALAKKGVYNVRAFSSMMGETFFAEVANQDKGGTNGTLTADEFAHYMEQSIEKMHIRLDTERTFSYRTSQTTAYKLVDNHPLNIENTGGTESDIPTVADNEVSIIHPR